MSSTYICNIRTLHIHPSLKYHYIHLNSNTPCFPVFSSLYLYLLLICCSSLCCCRSSLHTAVILLLYSSSHLKLCDRVQTDLWLIPTGSLLGPWLVCDPPLMTRCLVTPPCTMCGNQSQCFIYPPGGALIMGAEMVHCHQLWPTGTTFFAQRKKLHVLHFPSLQEYGVASASQSLWSFP